MQTIDPLKLISLNIDGCKHLDQQIAFFISEAPDVLCLQEIFESDFLLLKRLLNMSGVFTPTWVRTIRDDAGRVTHKPMGIATLSRHGPMKSKTIEYAPSQKVESVHYGETLPDEIFRVLLIVIVSFNDIEYVIGNTHFTWSPNGIATTEQKRDCEKMLHVLKPFSEIILCGDYNASRGGEIFDSFALIYKDNIPAVYTTSIDGNIHRAGQLDLMVDGLFSTHQYSISNVKLISGLSDHCAISANIN